MKRAGGSTWWDRRGTEEWAQYDFDQPRVIGGASVYWWDDHRLGRHCAAPTSWRLLFRKPDGSWEPVRALRKRVRHEVDVANAVEFEPIETTALRIEAKLRPGLSAGILQWQVSPPANARTPGRHVARAASARSEIIDFRLIRSR